MWIRGGGKTLIHKMWIKNMFFFLTLPLYRPAKSRKFPSTIFLKFKISPQKHVIKNATSRDNRSFLF